MHQVDLYFDFISPYSWLGMMRAESFAAEHGVRWRLRPVVYAALLDATGLVGPAEIDAKRRYTFFDIARAAQLQGLRVVGPPAHPFRSLDALRLAWLVRDEPYALPLCAALANAAWGEGKDLTDPEVRAEVAARFEVDPDGLAERASAPEVKAGLRSETEAALEAGVFGVPSFVYRGELFWGHDRLEHLAARLAGRLGDVGAAMERVLDRPRAVERSGSPRRGG